MQITDVRIRKVEKEGKMKDIVMKVFYAVRALPGVLWTIYLVKTNNQGFIWTVVDITSAIPTFVNVAVILILSNQYFKLLKDCLLYTSPSPRD